MLQKIKKILYFPVANYFKFFAKIQLKIWGPRIFVITGSSGKTTLLHLIESQIRDGARFSHKANSSYGIPFDILGLERAELTPDEWIYLFLLAPFRAFKKPFQEKLYFVEADCDRPGEGKFLADLLKPEVCMWLNVSRTHSMNFERQIKSGLFKSVEDAIAFEFGYFAQYTKKLLIINGDSKPVTDQLKRVTCPVIKVSKKDLKDYTILDSITRFKINEQEFKFPYLLSEDTFYGIYMCLGLINYLSIEPDSTFVEFKMPPGRNSLFKGIKNTLILDSSYNANLSSMSSVLNLFKVVPASKKWVVLSDMTEQGKYEKVEHQKLAEEILSCNLDRIILMGPRMINYTYPILKSKLKSNVILEKFLTPKEVLDYLKQNLEEGSLILFKGARFLEGVIEHLLEDKNDIKKLCRREKVWQQRREKWGL